VWTWLFRPDRTNIFSDDTGRLGGLFSSIDQVPVIEKLDETVNIVTAVFDVSNPATKNTIINLVQGNS
jgi:Mor family transcriptional regulator